MPRFPIALFLAALLAPARIVAQSCSPAIVRDTGAWSGPLARFITTHGGAVPLRTALETVGREARIRLAWSDEAVPLDRTVCLWFDSVTVGDVLTVLLDGAGIELRAVGNDLVVLSPARRPEPVSQPEPSVFPLDPVVVSVQATDIARAPPGLDVAVVGGRELARTSDGSLGGLLNGIVPGVWTWQPSPNRLTVQYGSVRGATSLGLGAPKVMIDGVEVANPLLLARLSPESIERIEVIRGPQAAALYGGGAIGGVTNIITRRRGGGGLRFRIRSGLDLAASRYTDGTPVGHDHAISVDAGTPDRSLGVDLTAGSAGEVVPGAWSRHVGADASARLTSRSSTLAATVRFMAERAGTPASPVVPDLLPPGLRDPGSAVSLSQYGASLRGTTVRGRWTHSLVLGADGYTLGTVEHQAFPFGAVAADTILAGAGTGAIRATLRFGSVAFILDRPEASATLTLSAEHAIFRQSGGLTGWNLGFSPGDTVHPPFEEEAGEETAIAQNATGIGAILGASIHDRLDFAAGLRLEHGIPARGNRHLAALPMLGAEWTARPGPVTLDLRAAWGKGIRWPSMTAHEDGGEFLPSSANLDLEPESQSGFEAGLDIGYRGTVTLGITRYDQKASGLIQPIPLRDPDTGEPEAWQYINVGSIDNRGWEIHTTVARGPLSIAATLTLAHSRIDRLTADYDGDLRRGDRALGVPDRTVSLAAAWTTPDWAATVTAARAADWINYDRVALAEAWLDPDTSGPSGPALRDYWRTYRGVTHLRATLTRQIRPGLSLLLIGDNLVGRQTGEPDNASVQPGRSIGIGLRAAF